MTATIEAIYRYPVKGLSPQRLPRVALSPGKTLPFDRAYAIENGPSGFDPAAPKYFPKIRFLMLMKNERLAALRTDFDDRTQTLTIAEQGQTKVVGDLTTPDGRQTIDEFFRDYMADELRGPPKVLHAEGHSFSDVSKKVVSIINLASVAAVGSAAGMPLDPLRFRANLHIAGWPAWHEFNLMGQTIAIGRARLKIVKRIVRCAATHVDPQTAARDAPVMDVLRQNFGNLDCGVYAEVREGGEIAIGDPVEAVSATLL